MQQTCHEIITEPTSLRDSFGFPPTLEPVERIRLHGCVVVEKPHSRRFLSALQRLQSPCCVSFLFLPCCRGVAKRSAGRSVSRHTQLLLRHTDSSV
ncbi:hypothetical protein FQA47_019167 [Oryzias melastigma]|uniref:Uncharacterized protein n=1 Tax=Oryzias melastigma TaxID=30732 RepID=A0A834F913_ORYME|nr:hypothetical protein FQA47_019167 [Oryzias melastigma]